MLRLQRLVVRDSWNSSLRDPSDISADAEGDFGDEFAAEAVVEAVEDFLAAVADDFREPPAPSQKRQSRDRLPPHHLQAIFSP